MPLNLASPGILVREVDLTIGRVDATSGSIGALVAPFTKGPVEEPQLIESEEDLLQTFGQPYSQDKQYEYWMVAHHISHMVVQWKLFVQIMMDCLTHVLVLQNL